MYSSKCFELKEVEFNYLLPVLINKLTNSNGRYYVIIDDVDQLQDIIERLIGVYENYMKIKSIDVYYCYKYGSLEKFRDKIKCN